MSGRQTRLVVAVSNLTADSDAVVGVAARIAERTEARLRVVHPLGVVGESLRKALFGAPPLQQRIETAAKRLSRQVEAALDGAPVRREVVLDHNRADTVTIVQAASGIADLVVVASEPTAAALPIASLAGLRTPLLFVPRFARSGTPCIIQALTQDVAPDAFLRAQRWIRVLQPVFDGRPVAYAEPGEIDILLCPDACADSRPTESAAATLRYALTERDPAIAVALLPATEPTETLTFAETMLRILITEARCPVLAVPPLPALRPVWTPAAFPLKV